MEEESDPSEQGDTPVEVALCICPHLQEFLAIDQRNLPGRPVVRVLSAEAVFDGEFYRQVEEQFSFALHQQKHPFTTLMALPQVVEAVVRQSSLQAILRALNQGVSAPSEAPQVAVLFFSGEGLQLDEEGLRKTLREVLGEGADGEMIAAAQGHLSRLLAEEEKYERQTQQDWLTRAIGGDASGFFTLWKQPD